MRNPLVAIILLEFCIAFTLAQNISVSSTGNQSGVQRKLTGCIELQNGKYALHEKSGKRGIGLDGSANFASYVGQSVTLRGAFAPALQNASAGVPESSGRFVVSKIEVNKLETASGRCNADTGKTEQASNGKPSPYHKR
jgi:hypothetical protein